MNTTVRAKVARPKRNSTEGEKETTFDRIVLLWWLRNVAVRNRSGGGGDGDARALLLVLQENERRKGEKEDNGEQWLLLPKQKR